MRKMKIKELLGNLFWKIVLPFYRMKWWFNNREERKRFRERQKWEYFFHSYETCMFYCKGLGPLNFCNRPRRFLPIRRLFWKRSIYPGCKKSKNCKYYFHDPIKRG